MTSLWLDRTSTTSYPALEPDSRFDHLVLGGGLTGVTTALLLARAGKRVGLLEARTLGAVATGNTTAKLSLLQGNRLSTIAHRHNAATVRAYVEANREGQQWLLRFCAEHDVATQQAPAFTYAQTPSGTKAVRKEYEACRRAGLDARWMDLLDLPFPTHGAVRLDDQAQFDPVEVLDALAADAVAHGAVIVENARARGITGLRGDELVVDTDAGAVRAGSVVVATGTPFLDVGGFFARLRPQRSYAMALRVPGPIPHGMYLSADQPTRSLRYVPAGDAELLLVGGNGHPVGRTPSTRVHYDDLLDWARTHWPGAEETHRWSAQDYAPVDELPYVGQLVPGVERILLATGYAKWGMTNAVAAALALTGRILGGRMDWARPLETWRPRELAGIPSAAMANAEVAAALLGGWWRGTRARPPVAPVEGAGVVHRDGLLPEAVCTVEGVTRHVSAVCPHLGGVVAWNEAERSWDCPLHGSRFAPDGQVLEGPATSPLTTRD